MNRLVTILCLVFLFNILSAANYIAFRPNTQKPEITILSSDLSQTEAKIAFPGFTVQDTVREGTLFQRITMPGVGITVKEGYPEVPQTVQFTAIDFTGEYQVSIVSVQYEEYDNIFVFPAQPQPIRFGQELPWTFNEEIYSQDAWYPANNLDKESAAVLRNYRVLPVKIRPVQFNPVQRKIRVATEIIFSVERTASTGENEVLNPEQSESPAFQSLYEHFIINYNQIHRELTPGINGLPDMLIITHDAYYNEVLPFAEWKNQKGVSTKVVRTSEIGANPTETQIKTYIQNYYNNAIDKPDYLLIVGDVTGAYAVPWFSVGSDKSDMPYYFLQGSDILPEVSGGRISVQNTTEAHTVFTKLIRYEKNPNTPDPNWFHSMLIINSNSFQDPTAGFWAKAHFSNYGYNPIHHLGDNLGNATVANVYSAVNSGVSYIYYIGHGAPSSWSTTGFSTTNIPSLTNGEMQPVISSVACRNADLDEYSDVFAEVWLKNNINNGAVGVMGFTENCAVYETDTLARGMVRAILSDSITAFGNVIDYGRLHMYQSYGVSCSEPMHQSILVGEPELQVWTKTPETINASVPQAAFFNIPFVVQVSGAQGPLANALVCYWDSLGNSARGFTDVNGEVTLDPGVSVPATGTVTISGHNILPVQSNIEILPPQGPYVMARKMMVEDSMGNGNHIPESGEKILLQIELKNIGVDSAENVQAVISSSDTNITIMNSQCAFGTISPGDTLIDGDFEINISQNCPHLMSIPVQLEISANGGNLWSQQMYLKIRRGAHIELAQQALDFPNTFLHFTSQMDLPVANTGPDTLWITSIAGQTAQFSAQPQQIEIAPGQQKTIDVLFTPDTTEVYTDTLIIVSSDPVNFQCGIKAAGTGIFSPDIRCDPDSLRFDAMQTDSLIKTIQLHNDGLGNLEYSAQVSGHQPEERGTGGADNFGHIWIDSDEPSGPAFNWIDISATGNQLALTGNNAISNPVNLGFDFSFYGNDYHYMRVCSNGWISFSTFSVAYNNVQLPSNMAPRSLIAPLWDDLMMNQDSKVYTELQGNKFIAQFQDIYTVFGGGPYDFQLILYDNGNILLQYLSLDSLAHDYTVGIQNQDATDGLTVAFNENYLHDSLAVLISKHSWLTIEPMSGTVSGQSSQSMSLTVVTSNFPLGDYYASIQIESNDPDEEVLYFPVHLHVAVVGIEDNQNALPTTVQLTDNYPNPFNPVTTIGYAIPSRQRVEISIYNLLGQKVKTLYNGFQNTGIHQVKWDGTNEQQRGVGSGIYIYKLKTEEKTIIKKMIYMK